MSCGEIRALRILPCFETLGPRVKPEGDKRVFWLNRSDAARKNDRKRNGRGYIRATCLTYSQPRLDGSFSRASSAGGGAIGLDVCSALAPGPSTLLTVSSSKAQDTGLIR